MKAAIIASCIMAATAVGLDDFDWSSIKPSTKLAFTKCYDKLECARFDVPLNWLNTSDSRRAVIAVVKYPATVPPTDKTYGGPIFMNPGGPGGSGVDALLNDADRLRELVDKPGKRHYDIISFDTRGTGFTTPGSDCFGKDAFSRNAFTYQQRGLGSLDAVPSNDQDLAFALAVKQNYVNHCKKQQDAGQSAFEFVGSPSVARDMVAMLDAFHNITAVNASASSGNDKDLPRMNYIGFSYGTALGNYFASMFPGRVGKFVLDGVLDASDYANNPGWTVNTVDDDEIFANFAKGCVQAGPDICALAHIGDEHAINRQILNVLAKLDKNPVPLVTQDGTTVAVRGNDARSTILNALYMPDQGFKPLAVTLNNAINGNFSHIAEVVAATIASETIPPDSDWFKSQFNLAPESHFAISCSDGGDLSNKTVQWWRDYSNKQIKQSSSIGVVFTGTRFACAQWPFQSAYSYKGPFRSPAPVSHPKPVPGRPAAPILFLSSRLDPVTPLSSARAMQKGHPQSRLVIQDKMGHTALAYGATSDCIITIVRDYFDSGKVPQSKETVCKSSCGPWDKKGCFPQK